MSVIRRRDFIAGLGAAAWPLRNLPLIGYLWPGPAEAAATLRVVNLPTPVVW